MPQIAKLEYGCMLNHDLPYYCHTAVYPEGTLSLTTRIQLSPAQLTQLLMLRVSDLDADELAAVAAAVDAERDKREVPA